MSAEDFEGIVSSLISHTEALLRDGSAPPAAAVGGLNRIHKDLRERGAPPALLDRLERYAAALAQAAAQEPSARRVVNTKAAPGARSA